jgi:putative ABC transport system substrate-binding protein
MRELGFSEGENLKVEYQGVDDPRGPFVAAAELMRFNPDLIVALGPEVALQAVVGASRAIPIVIAAVNFDPIARGYIRSMARPGGNITGVFFRPIELAAKQLELMTDVFPGKVRLGVLFDAHTSEQFSAAQEVARTANVDIWTWKFDGASYDFNAAFGNATAANVQMALILSSPAVTHHRSRIAELAIQHRLPTMFTFKHYIEAGGLMAYGVDFPPMYRRTADYVAKILSGTRAADLPVEQADKFQFVVNLKTAKALGLEIPPTLLARADEVIE